MSVFPFGRTCNSWADRETKKEMLATISIEFRIDGSLRWARDHYRLKHVTAAARICCWGVQHPFILLAPSYPSWKKNLTSSPSCGKFVNAQPTSASAVEEVNSTKQIFLWVSLLLTEQRHMLSCWTWPSIISDVSSANTESTSRLPHHLQFDFEFYFANKLIILFCVCQLVYEALREAFFNKSINCSFISSILVQL